MVTFSDRERKFRTPSQHQFAFDGYFTYGWPNENGGMFGWLFVICMLSPWRRGGRQSFLSASSSGVDWNLQGRPLFGSRLVVVAHPR